MAGPSGRILLRPWALRPEEYVAHAFDQMRQAAASSPQVVAALARVLRMLIAHLDEGSPDVCAALDRQLQLLLDAAEDDPEVHPEDRERVRAIARAERDPAEHET